MQSILAHLWDFNNDAAGGGYVDGSADDIRYNGSFLVQRSVNMSKSIVSFNFYFAFTHLHIECRYSLHSTTVSPPTVFLLVMKPPRLGF